MTGGRRHALFAALALVAGAALSLAPTAHAGAAADSLGPDVGPEPAPAPAPAAVLTLRGRVVERSGRAVAGTQVFAEGSHRAEVTAGTDGRWRLTLRLGTLDSLLRSPAEVWLAARALGARVDLADGAPRLRFQIRARDDSVGGRHVVVRSNDSTFTRAMATALRADALDDTVEVRFVAAPGAEAPPLDVAMTEVADVIVVPGALPRPLAVGVEPVADTGAVAPPRAAAADTCACRIEGTIEVQWDRPLPSRVPVELWLEDAPAVRDAVELVLGSPRAFRLEARGCGPHRVRWDARARQRFNRVTADPVVTCGGERVRNLRIVLVPVSRLP